MNNKIFQVIFCNYLITPTHDMKTRSQMNPYHQAFFHAKSWEELLTFLQHKRPYTQFFYKYFPKISEEETCFFWTPGEDSATIQINIVDRINCTRASDGLNYTMSS